MNNIFKIIPFTLILLNFDNSSIAQKKVGRIPTKEVVNNFPKIDFKVFINNSVLNYGERVLMDIVLKNNGTEVQKLLFDKPKLSTGGPWGTSGKVINVKTGKSVLKYDNKAMLSSQLYFEEQLKNEFYILNPGETLNGKYTLNDIVVLNTKDYKLPRGTYKVQLFYYGNSSNIVTITVK